MLVRSSILLVCFHRCSVVFIVLLLLLNLTSLLDAHCAPPSPLWQCTEEKVLAGISGVYWNCSEDGKRVFFVVLDVEGFVGGGTYGGGGWRGIIPRMTMDWRA